MFPLYYKKEKERGERSIKSFKLIAAILLSMEEDPFERELLRESLRQRRLKLVEFNNSRLRLIIILNVMAGFVPLLLIGIFLYFHLIK